MRGEPDRKLENARGRTPGLARRPGEATAEFRALEQFLAHLPGCLKPGARVAILTFHSGEERRVKKAFHAGHRDGIHARIAADPIRPSPEERRANPRTSSAKLRWVVKKTAQDRSRHATSIAGMLRPRSSIRIPRSWITPHSNQQVMP
jgi:hypothetical protein